MSKPRARQLGIPLEGTPGLYNAITDIPGVEVGYSTLVEGERVRTGVTMIHPRGKANHDPGLQAGSAQRQRRADRGALVGRGRLPGRADRADQHPLGGRWCAMQSSPGR